MSSPLGRSTYFAAADGVMSLADTFVSRDPSETVTVASLLDLLATTAELLEMEAQADGAPEFPRLNQGGRRKVEVLRRRRDYLQDLEVKGASNSHDGAESAALTWALERLGMEGV